MPDRDKGMAPGKDHQHIGQKRMRIAKGIQAFYEYNNTAPTKPFAVDMDHVYERFPELEGKLDTMGEWTKKQDWGDSNYRPAFG